MSPVKDELRKLSDRDVLARLIWAEARGETHEGKIAVGCVVMNRVRSTRHKYGKTIMDVALAPWQFSCFNDNDPNAKKVLNPPRGTTFDECLAVADMLVSGSYIDVTNGATHYFNPKVCSPKWKDKMEFKKVIGRHAFYFEP